MSDTRPSPESLASVLRGLRHYAQKGEYKPTDSRSPPVATGYEDVEVPLWTLRQWIETLSTIAQRDQAA